MGSETEARLLAAVDRDGEAGLLREIDAILREELAAGRDLFPPATTEPLPPTADDIARRVIRCKVTFITRP